MATELNKDGLAINYGPKTKEGPMVASPETDGSVKEVILSVNSETLNASLAGTVMGVPLADLPARQDMFALPAGSSIVSIHTSVDVPFVGGTFTAQLVTGAGAAVASTATAATGAATGTVDVPAAAGVETLVPTYVDAKPSAPLTAGSAKVIIRYV